MKDNIKNFAYAYLLTYVIVILYFFLAGALYIEAYKIGMFIAILIGILYVIKIIYDWKFIIGEMK